MGGPPKQMLQHTDKILKLGTSVDMRREVISNEQTWCLKTFKTKLDLKSNQIKNIICVLEQKESFILQFRLYLHDLAFDMILPDCNFLLDIMHVCFNRESLLCDDELPAQMEITSWKLLHNVIGHICQRNTRELSVAVLMLLTYLHSTFTYHHKEGTKVNFIPFQIVK